MADDLHAVGAAGCDEVRDSIELLALDALDPAERDLVLAHVEGCTVCHGELEVAREALGELLLLAPEVDVPPGFADRVLAGAPTSDQADQAPAAEESARRWGATRMVGVAAACVVVALLLTALGVALGTVFASDERAGDPTLTSVVGRRSAPLVTADGGQAGSVVVDDAGRTLVMAVDAVAPDVPYDCVVRAMSGELVRVGSWTPATPGGASWTVALDPALGQVDEVLLVGPGGTTLATAHLA